MKVVKNINNNVAICLDSSGKEIVVFAKGIGFKKPPYEVDVRNIQRTFYDVDQRYVDMMRNADEKIVDISINIKTYTDNKNIITSTNLLFSLIDHISYSIERYKNGIYFNLPIARDIQHMFKEEMEVGKYGLNLIKKELDIILPKEEAAYIAMNIINSETEVSNAQAKEDATIRAISQIIQNYMNFKIDYDGISYSRFESHMHYLLKGKSDYEENKYKELLNTVKDKYKKDYKCALMIKDYLECHSYGILTDDELLFITMHINKLRIKQQN